MKRFLIALAALLALAPTALADGHNAPVAVKTEEGVFLSWPMESGAESYTVSRNGELIATTELTNYTDVGADGSAEYSVNGTPVAVWNGQYLEIPLSVPTEDYGDLKKDLRCVTLGAGGASPSAGAEWSVYTDADGSSVFIGADGKTLDVNAQSTAVGASVGVYGYNGGDNQKFAIEGEAGDTYIKGKQSGLYLALSPDGALTLSEKADATAFSLTDSGAAPSDEALETAKNAAGRVTYSANDASVGDLDGDGEWEIVLKWDPSDSKDASQQGKTGRVYLDALELDGTRLWRVDMGPNIRAGAHDTQFVVYDLDGDGKAEVATRTADGTVDGTGAVIGDANAVWTDNWAGKNLEGPIWLTVFDGETGALRAKTDFDPQNGPGSSLVFGDDYGNRSERYNACVAYLDGENPYVVFQRGYYGGRAGKGPGRTVIAAYGFKNNEITKLWRFDTQDAGNEKYIGQGNHNISVGDCDGDGRDEIFTGALALDDDGSVLWCSFMGHGDAMHLGDFDPNRPGLELFAVHEDQTEAQKFGFTVFDAKTGEILHAREGGKDTGRGLIASVGPFGGSYIAWAGSGAGKINSLGENLDLPFNSMNFRIYWDGDLYDELLDGTSIFKIDDDGAQSSLLDASRDGCVSNNGSKSNPCLQADILGDWREEILWRSADSSCLRLYTTTIPTEFALPPLMSDHIYRMGVVWQNSSYNQPPHLGGYIAGVTRLKAGSAAASVCGKPCVLDAAPYVENGRTLVPLRFIAEALGAKVDYENGVVTAALGDKTAVMTVGSASFTVNGEAKTMETPPVIVNGRTLVPLRALGEALGLIVDWDGERGEITVKRGDLPEMTYVSEPLPYLAAGAETAEKTPEPVTLFIASDSTAQSYRDSYAPQAGWGQMLGLFMDGSVTVENRAMAGRSLKSFFDEGRWGSILNDARAGDYVIIQFGHNDGAWNKPERYLSHEDFEVMLENEYVLPALAKGLKPILASHTQPRWFDEGSGLIPEPDGGTSYDTIQRDMAEKYGLPFIDVNAESRALENALGPEASKRLHLYAGAGEYEKYPDGVADNTHYSYEGAFEIAKIVAAGLAGVPDLAARITDGYSMAASFEGDYAFDVRPYGRFDEFSVAIYSPEGAAVAVNGETVLAGGSEAIVRAEAQGGKINISASGPAEAEVTPVRRFAPEGGIDTAAGEYELGLPAGEYDLYFTKADAERGNIYVNSQVVGANVDMYGTVAVPEGTVHVFRGFKTDGGAAVRVDQRTTRLKAVEAVKSPSVLPRKKRIFVAGDSTLCNYYPVIPDVREAEIPAGERRTGWAQLLPRFTDDSAEVVNLASSGDWARDWKDVIFPTVLAQGEKGDLLVIQFGINDRNRDDKSRDTMKDALRYMIDECGKKGIVPVLVKPQPSVGYTWGSAGEHEAPNGNNGGFFDAVAEVAAETGCAYVDLYALAGARFAELGRDYVSRNYQLWNAEAGEMADKLHISFAGARELCSLFVGAAADLGLIKTDGYYEVTDILNGVYVLRNGNKLRLYNGSTEKRTVTAELSSGETALTLSPNEWLSLGEAGEVKL